MSSLRAWALRFRGLFDKERKDRELAEELESHLQMHIEDNLRAGMSPAEARRNALLKMGGLEQTTESYREHRSFPFIESVLQDFRFGLRILRKNPGFAVVVALTLALGIGAIGTIFSFVNGTLLNPLPLPSSNQLVEVWETLPGFPPRGAVSLPDFKDWQEQNQVFRDIAAFQTGNFNLQSPDRPERVSGALVTPNFFDVMSTQLTGRGFVQGEDVAGRSNVAVISDGLWKSFLGGNPNAVGQSIRLNAETFTVIGIAPSTFRLPDPATQVWVPFVSTPQERENRGSHFLRVVGRLKDGVTVSQATAQMSSIERHLGELYPRDAADRDISIKPLKQFMVEDIRASLLILFAAAVLVFLIVCANVLNLLLTRTAARQREIAIRAATGATPRRLLRQFLTENLTVSLLGGGLAWVFAELGTRLIVASSNNDLPGARNLDPDTHLVAHTLALVVLAAVILGIALAIRAAKINVQECLKEGSAVTTLSNKQGRTTDGLVIVQVAGALVLVIGALLLIESFWRLLQVNPGLQPEHVLTMRIALPTAKYSAAHPESVFYKEVLNRIDVFPDVRSAGLISILPIQSAGTDTWFQIEGRPEVRASEHPDAELRSVSPDYFRTLGIPLVRGRYLLQTDDENAPVGVIINKALADKFFLNQDPIGQRIRGLGVGLKDSQSNPESEQWIPIVGVVGNTRQFGLSEPAHPELDVCYLQVPLLAPGARPFLLGTISLVVQTTGDPNAVANEVRKAVSNSDPDQPVYNVKTMQDVISTSVGSRRFEMFLLLAFAVLSLVLAAVGIYGVISYAVRQRTHEIGIRVALGARRGDVLKMVISTGMKLALIGTMVGIVGGLALTRFLSKLVYGVRPNDPATFIAVTGLLLVVALAACLIPALRATRIDPMVALRFE